MSPTKTGEPIEVLFAAWTVDSGVGSHSFPHHAGKGSFMGNTSRIGMS